jgi:GNAT superfamily N-acetyltransferase
LYFATVPADRVDLPSGSSVWIRPIRPDDKDGLRVGLGRLSAQTIHRRFLAAKPRFTSAELRYLTEIDGRDHIALVAVDADGDLVAVARFVRFADRPDTAEMAVVVGDPLQGQGLGRALALRLADAALASGIRFFAATMLGENEPARRLVQTISARFAEDRAAGALREIVAELAPARGGATPRAAA